MAIPSQSPVRYPSGVSFDNKWGPLADFGHPHPFSYHIWKDDFDILAAEYTATKTGNGTIAVAAGDGGNLLFTTNSSTPSGTDICSIQLPSASFARPAASVGKKIFFLARLQVASALNAAFNVGLIQTTTTPFTVTDGVYFFKATGSAANLKLRATIGSVNTDLTIPTLAYTLANNTSIDLAFAIDRNGTIYAYVGSQLVGWLPASSQPTGQVRGPIGNMVPAITTANLNPTIAVQSGAAASTTMQVDFAMAAKER